MEKNYLLITLGHNSSAIFVDNSGEKQRIIGYEQERLSRIKADSQFPIDAINEIERNVGFFKMQGCVILISHWFNFSEDYNTYKIIPNKYITEKDIEKLNSYCPARIKQVCKDFTHHDAHAYSAHAFFKHYVTSPQITHAPVYTIVIDGFGNNEEVLSIYTTNHSENGRPNLVCRVYGYQNSLGLFYQYATSFCGMKENQDEYKFLGYEAHIDEVISEIDIEYLNQKADELVDYFLTSWDKSTHRNKQCKVYPFNLNDLLQVKEFWYNKFSKIMSSFSRDDESYCRRCATAYLVQQTCERVIINLIKEFGMQNVIVAGGTFYNVKLNNKILANISGTFCAMPLAGDQGAAIGLYEYETDGHTPFFSFETLAWGVRRLYNFEKFANDDEGIHYREINSKDSQVKVAKEIATLVANGHLVDVVYGNMEFGPRALGNTSTIFLPTTENTAANNLMNLRNEVMPCAPICKKEDAEDLFGEAELERVVGSDYFMICTHTYKKPYSNQYGGVMHKKTLAAGFFTGRPQIVKQGSFMSIVLSYVKHIADAKCLVNTSFNAHGNPIVFDTKEIIDNFKFQQHNAKYEKRPELFVIKVIEK